MYKSVKLREVDSEESSMLVSNNKYKAVASSTGKRALSIAGCWVSYF